MKGKLTRGINIIEGQLAVADFSGMELRIVSALSKSPELIEFFNKGHPVFGSDFHSMTATNLYRTALKDPNFICPPKEIKGEDNPAYDPSYHTEFRNAAKILSFSIVYGATAISLKEKFGVEEDEMQVIIDSYFLTYPEIKELLDGNAKESIAKGYIRMNDVLDRRYFIPGADKARRTKKELDTLFPEDYRRWSKEKRDVYKKKLYTKRPEIPEMWRTYFGYINRTTRRAYNYPIQGTGADILKIGLCIMRAGFLKGDDYVSKLIHNVHDEVLLESTEAKVHKAASFVIKAMEAGGRRIYDTIPMTSAYEVGVHWSH